MSQSLDSRSAQRANWLLSASGCDWMALPARSAGSTPWPHRFTGEPVARRRLSRQPCEFVNIRGQENLLCSSQRSSHCSSSSLIYIHTCFCLLIFYLLLFEPSRTSALLHISHFKAVHDVATKSVSLLSPEKAAKTSLCSLHLLRKSKEKGK